MGNPTGNHQVGDLVVRRRDDGRIELGEADPLIMMSLGLLLHPTTSQWLVLRDGMVCVAGLGPDDQPREVRYRATGFRPAGPTQQTEASPALLAELAAHEGGALILERIA